MQENTLSPSKTTEVFVTTLLDFTHLVKNKIRSIVQFPAEFFFCHLLYRETFLTESILTHNLLEMKHKWYEPESLQVIVGKHISTISAFPVWDSNLWVMMGRSDFYYCVLALWLCTKAHHCSLYPCTPLAGNGNAANDDQLKQMGAVEATGKHCEVLGK